MRNIIGFLCLIFCTLNSNARLLITKINEINFHKFNINEQFLYEIQKNQKSLYIKHDEFDQIIDLGIYNNTDFNEAKIDNSGGGGD